MQREWYREDVNKVLSYFKTSDRGLTSDRVEENKKKFGENVLSEGKKRSLTDILISQINNPLVYVLIIADIIVFLLQDYTDGLIILFIIVLNTVIGVIQEGKAENTLAALKKVIKTYATVIRNGREERIPDYEVVAGDILVLKDGDPVAADARIIECNTLKVNEASLTGESEPVIKKSNPISSAGINTPDQKNMLFKGTYVSSGLAKAVVVRTGIKTVIGQISKQLVHLKMDVPLKKNIHNLSKILLYIITVLSIVLFFYGIYGGYEVREMFVTVVAIAVSAIPESLPVVVTLVLSTGVWRMSQKNVLVKRLQAVEALGQANVIALDKTGTITKNQMTVEKVFVGGKTFEITGSGYDPKGYASLNGKKIDHKRHKDFDFLIKTSLFTSVSGIEYSESEKEWGLKYGDPTEAAILVLGKKFGYEKHEVEVQYPKLLELPFELETKHHSTVNKMDGKNVLSVVGSPDLILEKSTQVWQDGRSKKLSNSDLSKLKEELKQLTGEEGYRVLGIGIKMNSSLDVDPNDLPHLTFLGFIAIMDAIRPEVKKSVKSVTDAGMHVVMITGDQAETAKSIAKKVGIFRDGDVVLTGNEISEMTDEKIIDVLDHTTVFARVTPKDKLRIIEMYKKSGKIIAMTGDGVNDALSLVSANLGISMGKIGTEVAREASDIVLLDDKFGNLVEAAEEGRNIYWSIRKSVLYLLSTNFGELLVITIAIFAGLPLPLIAAQIIWLNLVTDTFLVASIAVDPKEENLLHESFKRPSKYLVDWFMGLRIILLGGVMTVFTLVMFLRYLESDIVKATTISLTILTVFQWYNIFNIRSHKDTIFSKKLFNNKYLIMSLFFTIGLHLFAIYHPFMQRILQTTGLNLKEWGIILVLGLSIVLVEEIRKIIYRFDFKKLFSSFKRT